MQEYLSGYIKYLHCSGVASSRSQLRATLFIPNFAKRLYFGLPENVDTYSCTKDKVAGREGRTFFLEETGRKGNGRT